MASTGVPFSNQDTRGSFLIILQISLCLSESCTTEKLPTLLVTALVAYKDWERWTRSISTTPRQSLNIPLRWVERRKNRSRYKMRSKDMLSKTTLKQAMATSSLSGNLDSPIKHIDYMAIICWLVPLLCKTLQPYCSAPRSLRD